MFILLFKREKFLFSDIWGDQESLMF